VRGPSQEGENAMSMPDMLGGLVVAAFVVMFVVFVGNVVG
jgi:hypothetical protein